MKIIVIAEHKDCETGEMFRVAHVLEHTPIDFSNTIAGGWQGEGAGLSIVDKDKILKCIEAGNIHKIEITLCG